MSDSSRPLALLSELENGQEADFFALLSQKEEQTTRDGKPYFRVTFRDHKREVQFPIWNDTIWANDCRSQWSVGDFFKLRAVFRQTNYGPQLEIRKIRLVTAADAADGFDPSLFLPRTAFDPTRMLNEILSIARSEIADGAILQLVLTIYAEHEEKILKWPAATRNHHAFVGGYLEHVLNVTKNAVFLARRYDEQYPDMHPRLDRDLLVAGAILHDIGKLQEITWLPEKAEFTVSGSLIGHVIQGRDIVRQAVQKLTIDAERLLRLEHIILSHQGLPEWGSPKPPMTPEALLVHFADDIDAKFQMMYAAIRDDATPGPLTSRKNPLQLHIYRGGADPT